MVKKYYFLSVMRNLVYIFIVLFLIACFVLCFFVDEIHSGVVFVMIFLSISIVLISIWIGFSFTFRIITKFPKTRAYTYAKVKSGKLYAIIIEVDKQIIKQLKKIVINSYKNLR